jgi:hypothetical protein
VRKDQVTTPPLKTVFFLKIFFGGFSKINAGFKIFQK